jgi:hypothetical protein
MDYKFTEYSPGIDENTKIFLKSEIKPAKDIQIGDTLSTGGEIVGLIRKEIHEYCIINGSIITPSTLFWSKIHNKWIRIGQIYDIKKETIQLLSFIVSPNSQLELENDLIIRDYMELCSPDSEIHYTNHLMKSD